MKNGGEIFARVLLLGGILFAAALYVYGQPKRMQPAASSKTQAIDRTDSNSTAAVKYYRLGVQYKDGKGVPMDYAKAFSYFSRAAALGDAQSIYATGYMQYKGLGTNQDYALAAKLFAQGAYLGRDNSMYFYGLCWRNGYGVVQNEDSAKYWLQRSAALGYKQAKQELQMNVPENGNSDRVYTLLHRIHNAALPEQVVLNQFMAIRPEAPDSAVIAGDYSGYLVQYDWSGQHAVSSRKLHVRIEKENGGLTGRWMEEGADSVTISAGLKRDSLVFRNSRYGRKDHYSPDRAVRYDFRNAALRLVRKGDSVYLAGDLYLFSPDRKEPSKPLLVALVRTSGTVNGDSSLIKSPKSLYGTDSTNNTVAAELLSVYPNPFTAYLNVAFKVNSTTTVGIELYNMAGQRMFLRPPERLAPGGYRIRIAPDMHLPEQTYVLRLVFAGGQEVAKVVKE